jgi:hypothetical protein
LCSGSDGRSGRIVYFSPLAQLEFGHRDRSIPAISLGLARLCEAGVQDGKRVFHHVTMLAFAFLAKYLRNRLDTFGCMFQAINQVMGILALEALVERKHLQAGEANQVGMLDPFDGDAVTSQQFCLDLGDLAGSLRA